MPIYEYRCDGCSNETEAIQKFSDPCIMECPKCKGTMHRITSQSAFVLKGGGWYKEGYSKGTPSESSKQSSPKKTTTTSKSKEKTVSKAS